MILDDTIAPDASDRKAPVPEAGAVLSGGRAGLLDGVLRLGAAAALRWLSYLGQPQSFATGSISSASPLTRNSATTGSTLCGVYPNRSVRACVSRSANAGPSGANSAS